MPSLLGLLVPYHGGNMVCKDAVEELASSQSSDSRMPTGDLPGPERARPGPWAQGPIGPKGTHGVPGVPWAPRAPLARGLPGVPAQGPHGQPWAPHGLHGLPVGSHGGPGGPWGPKPAVCKGVDVNASPEF